MANLRYIIFLISMFILQAKTMINDQDEVIQPEPNNILLKDDLKVDLDICEDDYEIVSKQCTGLRIKNEAKLFKEFNRMASKAYDRAMERNRADARVNDQGTKSKRFKMIIDNRTSSYVTSSNVRISQTRNSNSMNEKVENDSLWKFDADALKHPSDYEFALQQTTSNTLHHCTESANGTGIASFPSLVAEFYTKRVYINLANHFWKIAAIWVVVYLVIAVPLWFTQGWGSCCLCCKFFKPQQTIQEAKNYLLLNPPGILVTKKGVIINYEPTEREKYCYEEFGHFLRTL